MKIKYINNQWQLDEEPQCTMDNDTLDESLTAYKFAKRFSKENKKVMEALAKK